jgi:protein ImuB
MRRRDAQGRCPAMVVCARDPAQEARSFEPVVAAVASFTPWVELSVPGTCATPTRGPSRYFGGDGSLVEAVRDGVTRAVPALARSVGVGVADGLFAARLAARAGGGGRLVAPGGTAAFLAPLPLSVLGQPELTDVLGRLGLCSLGDLAALPAADVLGRFGLPGQRARQLARGFDVVPIDARPPPVDLSVAEELDPPVARIDQAAFVAKSLADRLSARLDDAGWSCLRLAVEAETEHGECLTRRWRHEGALTPAAMAERVRWQLEGWLTAAPGGRPSGGLTRLALVPDQVVPAQGRQLGFWGGQSEAARRAARAAGRVAALLGPEAVNVVQRRGGRHPAEQFSLLAATAVDLEERATVPAAAPSSSSALSRWSPPWPGRLPSPSPAVVWADAERPAAVVLDEAGAPVMVGGRGELGSAPFRVEVQGRPGSRRVRAWAGPWPVEERWWDASARRRLARLQVVLDDDHAWLLVLEGGRWWVAAGYE